MHDELKWIYLHRVLKETDGSVWSRLLKIGFKSMQFIDINLMLSVRSLQATFFWRFKKKSPKKAHIDLLFLEKVYILI